MVAGFFPTPYPDECLYSILCRYYARNGSIGYEATSKTLFGNVQTLTASIYQPIRIECADTWVPPSSGITRNSIAASNTLYPYWAISYSPAFRMETERVLNGGAPPPEFDRVSALKSRRSWSKRLKYCPLCAAEDKAIYGEIYWHRQHQLSEMLYCAKHEIRLANSEIAIKRATTGFYPASASIHTQYDYDVDELSPYKDKLLRISRECEWLIEHGLEIDWHTNGYEKYWRVLRDKGLASFQGRCDYPALEVAFRYYWGSDFLAALFAETDDNRFKGWTHQVEQNKIFRYKPLYHILLMGFLSGSVSNFVNANPAETPYGHPPFVCENPICPHYHMDGAEMVTLKYYGNGATATFECGHCGMIYSHNKAKHSRELRVVKDYGPLWNNELLRCCQDPKITNPQTAKILKCSMSVLTLQKKKRGLLEPALYDTGLGPEVYYKNKVTALCAEYDEVTISLLQEKVPGAYSYLGDHDPTWLRRHIVFENERKHFREQEEMLLRKAQEAVAHIINDGYPNRQVTYGYIAGLIGSTRDKLRYREPIRSLLDNIIESKADWLRRRASDVCANKLASAKPITTKTVRRELNLHPGTFAQYKELLQEVIDTAYGKN